jgi:2-polyprenyl-3-methyl-5-hydroxy-6-metoxy-1,4-benzoquinol methylase
VDLVQPDAYRTWRESSLGAITEEIEQALIWRMAGPLAGLRLLDVGCGDGAYAVAAAQRGALVRGVDASPEMIAAARRRAAEQDAWIDLQLANATQLPFADGSFDVVLAVTVLCFVADASTALREMARVLAPGGRLVMGELGGWSAWAVLRRLRGWAGSRLWRAARFRSAGQLRRLVEQAGLRVERMHGAVFYPPQAMLARLLAPVDLWLGRATTCGAAFIALAAEKPSPPGYSQTGR